MCIHIHTTLIQTATLLTPFEKHQISRGLKHLVLYRYFRLILRPLKRTVFPPFPTPSSFSVAAGSCLSSIFTTDSMSKYSWAALFPSPFQSLFCFWHSLPSPPPLHTTHTHTHLYKVQEHHGTWNLNLEYWIQGSHTWMGKRYAFIFTSL